MTCAQASKIKNQMTMSKFLARSDSIVMNQITVPSVSEKPTVGAQHMGNAYSFEPIHPFHTLGEMTQSKKLL